jgi:4-carboxymuconolactone decarboxylase
MTNTPRAKPLRKVLAFASAMVLAASLSSPAVAQALSGKQLSIAPIAAATASGDMPKLDAALNQGLDARRQRGVQDAPGREPDPVPVGKELLAAGTANQTRLVGSPVRGPLFQFAPAIDEYLKTHLFGDIFARANLDWQSRELATVGALAAMTGVESQLQSHIAISMNVGLTAAQLRELADVLAERGQHEAASRARQAIDSQVAQATR